MPSFFLPSDEYDCALPSLKQHLEILDEEPKPKVLVNTFDALEPEALKAIDQYNLVGIRPLMPSAFLDGNDPSDTTFGGDLFKRLIDYMEWLAGLKAETLSYLCTIWKHLYVEKTTNIGGNYKWVIRKQQREEITYGLFVFFFFFVGVNI